MWKRTRYLKARVAAILRRRRAAVGRPRQTATPLRIHLGCGREYWPGYVNVDADPLATYDRRATFGQIGRLFKPLSTAEVVMIHSLGYLRLWEARTLFRDVFAILERGGVLVIETPDLGKCMGLALRCEADEIPYLEAVRAIYGFGAGHEQRRERFQPYAFGWAGWHLRKELLEAGFSKVSLLPPQQHDARVLRDIRVEAEK